MAQLYTFYQTHIYGIIGRLSFTNCAETVEDIAAMCCIWYMVDSQWRCAVRANRIAPVFNSTFNHPPDRRRGSEE